MKTQVFMQGYDITKSTTAQVLLLSKISVMRKTCLSTAFHVFVAEMQSIVLLFCGE